MPGARASLPPSQRRRFSTGSAALDFVQTGGLGPWVAADLLTSREDLETWLGLLVDRDVRSREKDLSAAYTVREAISRITRRHLTGRQYRPRDVDVVNAATGWQGEWARLDPAGTRVEAALTARQALGLIAADAVVILSEPQRSRVRECADPDCQLLLFDTSRSGRRQWCSMARCGNLTKTRAYRDRAAAKPAERPAHEQ